MARLVHDIDPVQIDGTGNTAGAGGEFSLAAVFFRRTRVEQRHAVIIEVVENEGLVGDGRRFDVRPVLAGAGLHRGIFDGMQAAVEQRGSIMADGIEGPQQARGGATAFFVISDDMGLRRESQMGEQLAQAIGIRQ